MRYPAVVFRRFSSSVLFVSWVGLSAAQGRAAVFVVDHDTDDLASACTSAPGDCSLRGAVLAANAAVGVDRIDLPPGSYSLTSTGSGEDLGVTGDLDVRESLVIVATSGAVGETVVSGVGSDRIFHVHDGNLFLGRLMLRDGFASFGGGGAVLVSGSGELRIEKSVLAENKAQDEGGATSTGKGGLVLVEVSLLDNEAASGGAVAQLDGPVEIRGTTFLSNSAVNVGGALALEGGGPFVLSGIVALSNHAGLEGGALDVRSADAAIENATFAGNAAEGPPTRGTVGSGGAIAIVAARVVLTNVTLSGNRASRHGGGIAELAGSLELNNVTIAANEAELGGGGVFSAVTGAFLSKGASGATARNSIIATNRAALDDVSDCASDLPFASLGHNLVGIADGCNFAADPSDLVGSVAVPLDPAIEPLAFNGGAPAQLTHALASSSPALDGGDPAGCLGGDEATILTADQRGSARPQDGTGDGTAVCDIGALEQLPSPPARRPRAHRP